ncbi:MAG: reactive intermediate/imine deaminase [Chitinophagaceae bacterium]|nr:reactive intermediate/imine deaminase [Anaerolineae bacterium]
MTKQVVFAENAPRAAGPYSHAIIANGMVYTAGQVGIVPAEGTMIEGGIREQTEQVLKNVRTVLEAAGSSLDKVVKTTVFLANMDDFAAMNTIYATFFPDAPPARSTIQAGRLPIGALVEIETIAEL